MSEAPATYETEQNGKAPPEGPQEAQGPQLPEGTITLPRSMVERLTRLLQSDQRAQDALYSYLEGKGETGPYTLVLPVVLLVKPQPQQGGP